MTDRLFTALFCAALTMLSGAALAQTPHADRFGSGFNLDPEGVPYSSKYYPSMPASNVISLMRKPELTEDQFVIRITEAHPKSGCAEISDYGYIAEYKDVYLDIAITGNIVDLRNQPKYAHFECDRQARMPVADIIINRSDLLKNETSQIRMHNGTDTNYYNITLTENKVMILPDPGDVSVTRRFKPHNLPGRKTALVHWFYPLGTIIMWVPDTALAEKAYPKLDAFAESRGLVPLETIVTDFKSPLNDARYRYYVDTAGRFADDDADLRDGKPVGAVPVETTVFGLEKDEVALEDVVVYAKRPGLYD